MAVPSTTAATRKSFSLAPIREIARKRILQRDSVSIFEAASTSWIIEPQSHSITPPAYFLEGQLDRVVEAPFGNLESEMVLVGNPNATHSPTLGFLIKDALLIDGVIYKGKASAHLAPRQSSRLMLGIDNEIDRASIYSTASGIRYFGQWLMDDCLTYPLAAKEGTPLTSDQALSPHAKDYELRLGMDPLRLGSARVRELVIFQDIGQNPSKKRRRDRQRDLMLKDVSTREHPGVFILRGRSGDVRCLVNETEIADTLRARHGFTILDPMQLTVDEIISRCAGANTVAGVEGSHLLHGIGLLGSNGNLLTLQPPNRFVWVLKHLTDRDHQKFGFVVGLPRGDDFYIPPDEVSRTLDLFQR